MLNTNRKNCYESYQKSRPQSKTRSSASYRHRLSVNIIFLPVNTANYNREHTRHIGPKPVSDTANFIAFACRRGSYGIQQNRRRSVLISSFELFSRPGFVQKATFLQAVNVAPVDEVLRLDFLYPRVDFSRLIEDCLKRFCPPTNPGTNKRK